MKKSTTGRIEDTLDIVAEKIIDLENTAKQLEGLKKRISSDITRFENLSIKIDTKALKEENMKFIKEVRVLNKHYLSEIDKKNDVHRPFYYLIIFLLLTALISFALLFYVKGRNTELINYIENIESYSDYGQ